MKLLEPVALGGRTARNRVVFGPHETNLARRRAFSDRHVAYYQRRAVGGAGVIVVEEASVHPSDWPYERAPLAGEAGAGWAAVASACQPHGALVLAALGHAGGQGSSAYSQAPLWAPSRVPEVNTREVPKWMEAHDIAAVVEGFANATALAVRSGLDGVEVNAGQHSLVRQFLSRLTNQRDDEWGVDGLRFAGDVLRAVRAAAGDGIVGLRLSCDELAPWAGIVPDAAAFIAAALAEHLDYVTVVRGSIFTVSATRPDSHVEPGFNLDLARQLRAALAERVAVVAQGSIVDAAQAEGAVGDGACDLVEMTRAQIADPDLARKLAAGEAIRPCILCNQACMVRDARNPIVSCVVEPRSGHEWEDAAAEDAPALGGAVLVVGGGVAGLECARVAAQRGAAVTLVEQTDRLGGAVRAAATGAGRHRLAAIADWLEGECRRLGVRIETLRTVTPDDVAGFDGAVVLCTGSSAGRRPYDVGAGATVVSAREALEGAPLPAGRVAVWDPIGGPIAISVAEWLRAGGRDVVLVTPDLIPGNELSRTGDLAPANVRLQSAGIVIERRSLLRAVAEGTVELEDRFTGQRRSIDAAALVDGGYRLPDDALWRTSAERVERVVRAGERVVRAGDWVVRAGDCVAPRSIGEAILEGRRAALAIVPAPAATPT